MSLLNRQPTPRTRRLLLGGIALFTAKVISGGALLLLTGMTSRYLSGAAFGLWSILTNLPILAATMDFGLGNTLRNKLANLSAASTDEENTTPRIYFFSCFFAFLALAVLVSLVTLMFYQQIPWHAIFSFHPVMSHSGWTQACALAVIALAIYFPFSLGMFGFFAYEESHYTAIFDNMLRGLAICAVLAIAIDLQASFFALITLFFGALLAATFLSWVYFLIRRSWGVLWPGWKQMKAVLKDLAPQSSQFAILQMSAGVILLTDPILVGWVSDLESAGHYALVQRLFTLITAVEALLLTPFWSAYTQAHASQEKEWVRTQLRRSVGITLALLIAGCVFVLIWGPELIELWTHQRLRLPALFIAMAIWTMVYGISHCFSVYLNAVGRLKRQSMLAAGAAIINIPLALLLGHYWGAAGVCWAGVICILPSTISNPIEAYRFLNRQ